MSNTAPYIIVCEWSAEMKFIGQWITTTLEEGLELVSTIKISSRNHKFTFENSHGTCIHNSITKPAHAE